MTTATTPSTPAVATRAARRRQPGVSAAAPTPAQSCVGVVSAVDAQGFDITSGALQARGRRAASCLLAPAVGDTVACLLVAPDEVWVLAVLQREEGTAHVLHCDGPLTVSAPALTLDTAAFALRAGTASVDADEAELTGRNLRVVGSTLKLVGSVLSTVFDRVHHFSRHHLRTTEGVDRVQATHIECEAQQLARVSGQHLLLNGQDLVKARGSQIHFG